MWIIPQFQKTEKANNASKRVGRKEGSNLRCCNYSWIVHKYGECRYKSKNNRLARKSRHEGAEDRYSISGKTVSKSGAAPVLHQQTSSKSIATIMDNSGALKHAVNNQSRSQTMKIINPSVSDLADDPTAKA